MIIIKTIILYFIQIRHTDDFPSTGTRIVSNNIPYSHTLRWQHTLNNLPLDVSNIPTNVSEYILITIISGYHMLKQMRSDSNAFLHLWMSPSVRGIEVQHTSTDTIGP